ncbi:MAG: hypothetical protein KME65_03570 [Candidatus Thiodiazotropha sp. (ex Ctena orbiculata)]|uniref:Uncharacterized protein n=1 Tax=Candidatus Thiodiazotropha taylori TaxID=2792791 RepID=A0A944QSG9_9GAMM|nr:hypothetical protein [Candidatus Thiodiazotropha taylori]MBV2138796.1 hypothetical protein [Candidatus Thiodiazotropha taylori]
MCAPEKIIAGIGKVYRLKRRNGSDGQLFTLDAFHEPYWYECQKWNDPGAVADFLVKFGIAADHETAFEMIRV